MPIHSIIVCHAMLSTWVARTAQIPLSVCRVIPAMSYSIPGVLRQLLMDISIFQVLLCLAKENVLHALIR